jgi:hypothetical protein
MPNQGIAKVNALLVAVVVALALSASLAAVLLAPHVIEPRDLPGVVLRNERAIYGLLTLVLVASLIGAIAGVHFARTGSGDERRRRGIAALALSLAAIAVLVLAVVADPRMPYARQGLFLTSGEPAYERFGVKELPVVECSRLDRLPPEDLVRAYFETRDPSVRYWLETAEFRQRWHEPDALVDTESLTGIYDLRIGVREEPSSATDLLLLGQGQPRRRPGTSGLHRRARTRT